MKIITATTFNIHLYNQYIVYININYCFKLLFIVIYSIEIVLLLLLENNIYERYLYGNI